MAPLDIMASHVHLKLKYYNDFIQLVIVKVEFCGDLYIHEVILKSPLMMSSYLKEIPKKLEKQ